MARNGRAILMLLVFSIGCRRQSGQPAQDLKAPVPPAPSAVSESHDDARAPVEPPPATAEPGNQSPENSATVDQAAERARVARKAADQQRVRVKVSGVKVIPPEGKQSSPKVLAAHEEVAAAPPAPGAPGRATLHFKNDAGGTFTLAEARFEIDGAELPTVLTTAARGQRQLVFSGELPPGRHVVASHVTYHGADRAVFSYMKGYTFKVQSDDAFVAHADHPVTFTIVCKEKTGFNVPVEKRLFITVEGHSPGH